MTTKNKASAEALSEEQSSRGYDLCEEITKKLTQAKAVCGAMMSSAKADTIIADSLWAAESLIEDAEKAFDELRDIYEGHTPKEVQS